MEKNRPKEKKKNINWAKRAVIFSGVMIVINIILITDIRITIPWFRKAAYLGTLLEIPASFQIKSRNVSPLYFVELIYKGNVSVKYKGKLKFSIKLKEKGKKPIQEPEFRIYLVDSIGDLRGSYPNYELIRDQMPEGLGKADDIERENLRKSINFSFVMPPEDQKVIGVWKIFVYLYDGSNNELTSYLVHDFNVTDKPLIDWLSAIGAILGFILAIVSITYAGSMIIKRLDIIISNISKIITKKK